MDEDTARPLWDGEASCAAEDGAAVRLEGGVALGGREPGPRGSRDHRTAAGAEAAPRHLEGRPRNLGVLPGESPEGLVKVDLVTPEAAVLAPSYLPPTGAAFGPGGGLPPRLLYVSPGVRREVFRDPEDGEVLLGIGLRGIGRVAVFPGGPARVEPGKLEAAVACLAVAAMVSRATTTENWHSMVWWLADAVCRELGEDRTKALLRPLAEGLVDPEMADRPVADAVRFFIARAPGPGRPKLVGMIGEGRTAKVAEWLDLPGLAERLRARDVPRAASGGRPGPTQDALAPTGEHLDGTPDEAVDATEAFERSAARVAREGGTEPGRPDGGGAEERPKGRGRPAETGLDHTPPAGEIARALCSHPHGQLGSGKLEGGAAGGREYVELTELNVNEAAARCAELLADEVFMRGPRPMVLIRVEEIGRALDAAGDEPEPTVSLGGVRHPRGALVFAEPSPARVQFRIDRRAVFLRPDGKAGRWRPRATPPALAQRVIEAASDLGFRSCGGIVNVPLFDAGRIVAAPGYDPKRQVFLDPPAGLPPIPEAPTRRDAEEALETLLRPFRCYLEEHDPARRPRLRCALAAAALTAVLRPSLPAAPAILLDANVPGAGKGKAGRALAVIATGRPPAVITEGHTAEETEKRLAAAILSGASCVMLDNLQGFLASSTLESGLTEGVATIRLFGKLEDVTVPCSALVVLTANNAAFRPDLLRRTLPVRIVADTDRPELRRFPFDPYEEARANRPAIVAAGLTIARAWWAARGTGEGREVERATLGSFEAWAALVGGAVAWLTGLHPIDLIEERKEVDPVLGAERRVFSALWDLFGEREWIAKDAAGEPAEFGRAGAGTGVDPEGWVAALPPFKGARPTSREVGYWLRRRKDRVVGDWQLTGRQDRNGVSLWRLRARPGVTPPRRRVDELAPLDPPGDGPS